MKLAKLYGIVWVAAIGGFNSITLVRGKAQAKKFAKEMGWSYALIGPLNEKTEYHFMDGLPR